MLGALIRTFRPAQWSKNVFVLAALVFAAGEQGSQVATGAVLRTLLAFAAFCAASSAAYLLNDVVDVENDLDLESDTNANLSAYLEHPVPVLPNVRLNYTRIEQSGSGEVSTQFDLVSGDVDSDLDLSQFDVTLYYEVLDN